MDELQLDDEESMGRGWFSEGGWDRGRMGEPSEAS